MTITKLQKFLDSKNLTFYTNEKDMYTLRNERPNSKNKIYPGVDYVSVLIFVVIIILASRNF